MWRITALVEVDGGEQGMVFLANKMEWSPAGVLEPLGLEADNETAIRIFPIAARNREIPFDMPQQGTARD